MNNSQSSGFFFVYQNIKANLFIVAEFWSSQQSTVRASDQKDLHHADNAYSHRDYCRNRSSKSGA
jgi:hypothetical protein